MIVIFGCISNQKTTEFLTGPEGRIAPRTPGRWEVPFNAICQWTINAPKGKVLRIWLQSVSLKSGDYLRVHDGPSESSRLVAQYNSSSDDDTYFISSGRSLWLELKTGLKITYYHSKRLIITYKALDRQECSLNTTLDAPVAQDHFVRKSLTTPYWPYGYRINTTCGWYIRAPEDHIIVLEYGYYSFCTDDISSEDSLRIYNVEGSELRPIRRFRRKWDISVSPLVYILFESDGQLDKIRDQGLCLYYMATKTNTDSDCFLNSTLEAPQLPITSNISLPYWPPGYRDMNITCGWYIKAPVNHLVELEFALTLNQRSKNSVQVYDVKGSELIPIALTRYNWIVSKFRSVYILFKREDETSVIHEGIFVKYKAIESECIWNMTLNASESFTRSFLLPNWPYEYRGLRSCGWYISAPENRIIVLELVLSSGSNKKRSIDTLRVYSVEGSELRLLHRFRFAAFRSSFQYIPPVSRLIYILYEIEDEPRLFTRLHYVSYTATQADCSINRTLDAPKSPVIKQFISPYWPSGYRLNTTCGWYIVAPENHIVRLFIHLTWKQLSENSVQIYDVEGLKLSPVTLAQFNLILSKFRIVYILLKIVNFNKTDDIGARRIHVSYSAIKSVSSGACIPKEYSTVFMIGEGGIFSTPGYPLHLEEGTCSWNITAPHGESVQLTLQGDYGSCDQNYAEVFDLTTSTRRLLGKFCFNCDLAEVVYSKGNNVLVRSRSSTSGRLIATYESIKTIPVLYVCAKNRRIHLNEHSGEFTCVESPALYPNYVNCSWAIEVPAGYLIQLTFHLFDLQHCQAKYVEIKQGMNYWQAELIMIGRFCGSSMPVVIHSNYSNLYVDFVTDQSGKGFLHKAFNASYITLPDPAVGACKLEGVDNIIPMTGETGRMFSPQFPPGTTPRSRMCTWIITVPQGHFVKLRITSNDLGDTCRSSSLEIRDGQSSASDLLKSVCAQSYESSVFSGGRHLWVRFQSPKADWSYVSGFSAEFEAVTQLPAPFSCTAIKREFELTSETGILASYNYPLPYDDAVECVWFIIVDTTQHIKLSFDFFNLSRSGAKCLDADYVQVGNGDSTFENSIQKFYGSEKPSAVTSKDSAMWVKFVSSGKTKYPGFKGSYRLVEAKSPILKIVAICIGVIVFCVVIGIAGYKHLKSRQNQAQFALFQRTGGEESESVLLKEQATNCRMTVETERITVL